MVNSYLYTTGGVSERIVQGKRSTSLQYKIQASKAIAEFDKAFGGSRWWLCICKEIVVFKNLGVLDSLFAQKAAVLFLAFVLREPGISGIL